MKLFIYKLISKLGYSMNNRRTQHSLELKKLKQFQNIDKNNILFRARSYIENIRNYYPDLNIISKEGGFIISFNSFEFFIESSEDIFIINEVFVDLDYGFRTDKSSLVIDIGANIGITSVFFSQFDFIKYIYSYEPIPHTYSLGLKNVSSNIEAHKKCQFFNFGLSNEDKTASFYFNNQVKGKTGVREYRIAGSNNEHQVEVELKNANSVISSIVKDHPDEFIMIKMDCEGSEYEIFQNLSNNNILSKIDVFFIEWHDKGSEPIEDILVRNNFNCSTRNLSKKSGFIFAYRT